MVLDLIKSVEDKLNANTRTEDIETQRTTLTKVLGELDLLKPALHTLSAMLPIYRDRIDAGRMSEFKRIVVALGGRLEASSAMLNGKENPLASLRNIRADLTKSQKMLTDGWAESVTSVLPSSNVEGLIRTVPELRQHAERFSALYRNILDHAQELPTTEQAVQALDAQIEELRGVVTQIDLSTAVVDFLEKVQSGQATLLDLTPEVWEWCSESTERLQAFKLTA